jgi:hypothetical protein
VNPRRLPRPVAIALLAVVGLAACSSPPSARRVALDVVETLDVSEAVKACMVDKIQTEYSEDELQQISEGADSGDPADVEALAAFEADLETCNDG